VDRGEPGSHHRQESIVPNALADALTIIGSHPFCTETKIEQGDTDSLHFFIENDKVGDPSWFSDLEADLASYDQDGRPYRITVYLPQEQDDSEPDQGPTAADRNPSMLRR